MLAVAILSTRSITFENHHVYQHTPPSLPDNILYTCGSRVCVHHDNQRRPVLSHQNLAIKKYTIIIVYCVISIISIITGRIILVRHIVI